MRDDKIHPIPVVNAAPPPGCFWSKSRLAVEIEQATQFLGDRFIFKASRTLLTGATGAGKTLFCMGIARAICHGESFLIHEGGASGKVLYFDYEVGREEMQRRLRFTDFPDETFAVVCCDDPELGEDGLLPLDSAYGQQQVIALATEYEADVVIIDNLYSACEKSILGGSDKSNGGQAHESVVPFFRKLSRMGVATVLAHHTGHDTTRGYGDSRLAWQMTGHIHLDRPAEAVDGPLSLNITTVKIRGGQKPQPFLATWEHGAWSHSDPVDAPRRKKLSPVNETVFRVLVEAIHDEGSKVPAAGDVPSISPRGVTEEVWRKRYYAKRPAADDSTAEKRAQQQTFRRARDDIEGAGMACSSRAGWWWLVSK